MRGVPVTDWHALAAEIARVHGAQTRASPVTNTSE
nr:MAG TPA_asm: hypothetical protein [Caudoviricetes sp.]